MMLCVHPGQRHGLGGERIVAGDEPPPIALGEGAQHLREGEGVEPGLAHRVVCHRDDVDPVPLLWQHRPDLRIGWIDTIAEDERGLRVIAAIELMPRVGSS